MLEEVIDLSLGIDIVNFRSYEIIWRGETGATIIDMSPTTMGCPLVDLLTDQIHDVLVEEVTSVDVKLVWYPNLDGWKMVYGSLGIS